MQHTSLTPDEELNILIHRTLLYIIIYTRFTNLETVRFLAHHVYFKIIETTLALRIFQFILKTKSEGFFRFVALHTVYGALSSCSVDK